LAAGAEGRRLGRRRACSGLRTDRYPGGAPVLMTPRQIATNQSVLQCDVCGRTLLRGEQPAVFLAGGSRRSVCELCTPRAAHEGWIREGVAAEELAVRQRGRERGGSLLARLRSRRDGHARSRAVEADAFATEE